MTSKYFRNYSSLPIVIIAFFFIQSKAIAQEASLDGVTLSIPMLQVGTDYYQISLNLLPGTDPIQLSLGDAVLLSSPADNSGASVFADNAISIPALSYDGVSYNLNLPLLTADPVVFQLGSVGVNDSEQQDSGGNESGDGFVIGGGDAWLFDEASCTDWTWTAGSATGADFSNNSEGDKGVKAGSFDASGCTQSATYHYGISAVDGERKVKEIRPPISESQQGGDLYAETETYDYTTRIVGSELIELLWRVDITDNDPEIPDPGNNETGYTSSEVWGYEMNTGSNVPRANRYEVWERVLNSNDYNELFMVSVLEWEYEDDGAVTSATFQEYDADAEEYLEGQFLFSMDGDTLVAEVQVTVGTDVIPTQKTEYPGLTLYDLRQLPLPNPHGQVLTSNSWRLPISYTRYIYDSDEEEWTVYESQTVEATTPEGYPIRVSNASLNEETGSMESLGTSYYGYKTDVSGTVYIWVDLHSLPEENAAVIGSFRTDIIEIQL